MLLAMSYFNVLKLSKVINEQIKNVSPYSVRMRENTNQNNSEYGHFSRSEVFGTIINMEALTWLQLIYLMRLFLRAFLTILLPCTAWKVSVFEVFAVRIQPECGKMRTRKTPNTNTFHSVLLFVFSGLMKMVAACFYLSLVGFIVIAGK